MIGGTKLWRSPPVWIPILVGFSSVISKYVSLLPATVPQPATAIFDVEVVLNQASNDRSALPDGNPAPPGYDACPEKPVSTSFATVPDAPSVDPAAYVPNLLFPDESAAV